MGCYKLGQLAEYPKTFLVFCSKLCEKKEHTFLDGPLSHRFTMD